MKKTLYLLLLLTLCCAIQPMFGQDTITNSNESSIVISESSLASLITLLRKHKTEKQENMLESDTMDSMPNQLSKTIIDTAEKPNSAAKAIEKNNDQNQTLQNLNTINNKEIEKLENKLSDLEKKLNENRKNNENSIATKPISNNSKVVPSNSNPRTAALASEKKIDTSLVFNAIPNLVEATNNSNLELELEIIALQLQIRLLKEKILSNNGSLTAYHILVEQFKGYKKELFFENGSFSLSPEATLSIEEVAAYLENYENLDVLVNGYASNVGLAIKNDKLSMERTEVVKKEFVHQGIHPIRIMTQYHGIDYKAVNDSKARRVEITFIVRK